MSTLFTILKQQYKQFTKSLNQNQNIQTFVTIALIIWAYYLVYSVYYAMLNPIPRLGDGWDYHIPIAVSILDGSFLTLSHNSLPQWHFPDTHAELTKIPQWYYPGAAQIYNAILLFLNIPIPYSNIFAVIVLFFACFQLGKLFQLKYYFAVLFAVTIVTVNAVFRWYNDMSLDTLMGIFFVYAIILLEKPSKKISYFAKLGFVFGMLVGSKFTGILFISLLTIIYLKKLYKNITINNLLVFLIPFSIFGLFWYVRNYFLTGNPFYPLGMLGFQGPMNSNDPMIREAILQPLVMFNGAFGEYKFWLFSLIIAAIALVYQFIIKKRWKLDAVNKLFLIGFINFLFFLSFPTSSQPWIMVSSFRYSYPVFIPLILGVFLLAQKYKKETLLGYISLGSMINVLSLAYYPKLAIFYIPLGLFIKYCFDKYKKFS